MGITNKDVLKTVAIDVPNLKTQLDSTVQEINKTISDIDADLGGNLNDMWTPTQQPTFIPNTEGTQMLRWDWGIEEFVTNLIDPLMNRHNGYITKSIIGKDQSGEYNFYKYEFKPKNPQKKIILGSCIHGDEISSIIGCIRFLTEVADNYRTSPQLTYIRNFIHIIWLPAINPWGMGKPYGTRSRQNSRGVNLNRNFDYKWSSCTDTDKGDSAFSEIESQYVRDVINANLDSIAFLSFHNTNSTGDNYVLISGKNLDIERNLTIKTINKLRRDNETSNFAFSTYPSLGNYSGNLGISSYDVEFSDMNACYIKQYSPTHITELVRWFGNIIIQNCVSNVKNFRNDFVQEPISVMVRNDSGGDFKSANTEWTKLDNLTHEIETPCDGILYTVCSITALNPSGTNDSQSYFSLGFGQNSTDWTKSQVPGQLQANECYFQGTNRTTITLNKVQNVAVSNCTPFSKVELSLWVKCTYGEVDIRRIRWSTLFIPSNGKDKFRILGSNGASALRTIYPL